MEQFAILYYQLE